MEFIVIERIVRGESRTEKRRLAMLPVLLVLAFIFSACVPPSPATGGDRLPMILLITSDVPPRLSGNSDVLLVAGASQTAASGALYMVRDDQLVPAYDEEWRVSDVFRTGPYIVARLAEPINDFGRNCYTILIHRGDLSTVCLEAEARCPAERTACPGPPVQANAAGNMVGVFNASTAEVTRYAISAGTVISSLVLSDALSFVVNDAGHVLVRRTDGDILIHRNDDVAQEVLHDATITCFFAGPGDDFYIQRAADILKLSPSNGWVPAAAWSGAPDFPCEDGGRITVSHGIANIVYDPAVTSNIRLYYGIQSDTGQLQTIAHVGPPTHMVSHGATDTVAYAGRTTISDKLVRVVGVGSQELLVLADDLLAFSVNDQGDIYYSAYWPIGGTEFGIINAGNVSRNPISQFSPWVLSVASMK